MYVYLNRVHVSIDPCEYKLYEFYADRIVQTKPTWGVFFYMSSRTRKDTSSMNGGSRAADSSH